MAICRYFEEMQPRPTLMGRTAVERAQIESLQRKMEFDGMIAVSEVFRNQHEAFANRSIPGGGQAQIKAIPELVERDKQTLKRFFGTVASILDEQEFLTGDEFTIVDITALCAIDFAAWVELSIPASRHATQRWYEAVSLRPSAKA